MKIQFPNDKSQKNHKLTNSKQRRYTIEGCSLEVDWNLSFVVEISLLGFGQRPFACLMPDFVAGQPAPGGLDREHAGELGRVPPTGGAGRALTPHAQRLAFQ